VAKYLISLNVQLTLISGLFSFFDLLSLRLRRPFHPVLAFLVFAFLSLRSRAFNILDNGRPDIRGGKVGNLDEGDNGDPAVVKGFNDRVLPSWTPPGIFFPIMWVLIITPLRSLSSLMIYNASGGKFSSPAVMALVLHLCVGDVWNTVNNSERRYGAAAMGVLVVLATAVRAAVVYGGVVPRAGKLLGLTAVWISVASVLTWDIWRLNGKDTLYPVENEDGTSRTNFLI